MGGKQEIKGRVDGQRYREMPEGHRTTLVVGMSDMVECLVRYMSAESQAAFGPILNHMRLRKSGELRAEFDAYLLEQDDCGIGISSLFLSLLIQQSGADRFAEIKSGL